MTTYLVLSEFPSNPFSLLATTKAFAFFFIVRFRPIVYHHQHTPEAEVYHLILSHSGPS